MRNGQAYEPIGLGFDGMNVDSEIQVLDKTALRATIGGDDATFGEGFRDEVRFGRSRVWEGPYGISYQLGACVGAVTGLLTLDYFRSDTTH